MLVHLESVQFHGVNGRRTVPLRRNEVDGSAFTTPEWRAGQAGSAAPVAFIAGDSGVFARLELRRASTPEPLEVEVCAVDSTGGGNLLGYVPWQRVSFRAGEATAAARLGFSGGGLSSVSTHQDRWSWRVRAVSSEAEFSLGDTAHAVYAILDHPGPPWDTDPVRPQFWVWADVLEVACVWAAGARSAVDAANRITVALHSLGDGPLKLSYSRDLSYACDLPFFFDCSAFLEMLSGNTPAPHIDCLAASSIVSTLANSLGARLFQAQTKAQLGAVTQAVRLIGSRIFVPLPLSRHDVGVHHPVSARDSVWDACLQFAAPGGQGTPAANLAFDTDGRGDYLGKLLDVDGLPLQPFRDTEQRIVNRSVMSRARMARLGSFLPAVLERLGKAAFDALRLGASDRSALFVSGFFWSREDLPGLTLVQTRELTAPCERVESWWTTDSGESSRVTMFETSSREAACELFAARLGEYTGPVESVPGAGEAAFRDPNGQYAAVMAGNGVWTVSGPPGGNVAGRIASEIESWLRPIQGVLSESRWAGSSAPVRIPDPPPPPDGLRSWRLLEGVNGRITRDVLGLLYTPAGEGPQAVRLRTLRNARDFSDTNLPW